MMPPPSRGAAGTTTETCALVGERAQLSVGETCPAGVLGNARGGYYHVAWSTLSGAPGAAAPGLLDERARIIRGDDAAAALMRGELDARGALALLDLLTAQRSNPYSLLGAVALAKRIDAVVGDQDRARWGERLATRFAPALHRSRKDPPAATELWDQLVGLIPADRYPVAEIKAATAERDELLADMTDELPADTAALAMPGAGDKLYTRIVQRARRSVDHDVQVSWISALGWFGASYIDRTIDLLDDTAIVPTVSWTAVERYLARPSMRDATWRALRPKLPKLVERANAAVDKQMLEAIAQLCDRAQRDDVAEVFGPAAQSSPEVRAELDRALATIDRCIAVRMKLGDFAAALAP